VSQHIAGLAIIVREYDKVIKWYCELLGFRLVEDTKLTDTKRWVRVAPVVITMHSADVSLVTSSTITSMFWLADF